MGFDFKTLLQDIGYNLLVDNYVGYTNQEEGFQRLLEGKLAMTESRTFLEHISRKKFIDK